MRGWCAKAALELKRVLCDHKPSKSRIANLRDEMFGWHEGRDPSAVFSTNGYLTTYTDVAADGGNPLQHYLQFGMTEGRSPTG
jgi:hypothetical protein